MKALTSVILSAIMLIMCVGVQAADTLYFREFVI